MSLREYWIGKASVLGLNLCEASRGLARRLRWITKGLKPTVARWVSTLNIHRLGQDGQIKKARGRGWIAPGLRTRNESLTAQWMSHVSLSLLGRVKIFSSATAGLKRAASCPMAIPAFGGFARLKSLRSHAEAISKQRENPPSDGHSDKISNVESQQADRLLGLGSMVAIARLAGKGRVLERNARSTPTPRRSARDGEGR